MKTNLVSHVFDRDSGQLLQVLVANVDQDSVDALVLAVDVQLGEHDDVLRVASPVCDLKKIECLGFCHNKVDSYGLLFNSKLKVYFS